MPRKDLPTRFGQAESRQDRATLEHRLASTIFTNLPESERAVPGRHGLEYCFRRTAPVIIGELGQNSCANLIDSRTPTIQSNNADEGHVRHSGHGMGVASRGLALVGRIATRTRMVVADDGIEVDTPNQVQQGVCAPEPCRQEEGAEVVKRDGTADRGVQCTFAGGGYLPPLSS
jgi:hypothetical protein